MRRAISLLILLGVALSVSACIVAEPGPGPGHERWCYWHPNRCR